MGNLLSTDHILDEETLITYVELTYLKRHEILHIVKLLDGIDPGKLRKNPQHRFTIKQIETILPQIRYSPLHHSIYRVFSSKKDGHLGLEDVLDLCSAFSGDCPEDVRAGWAFRIFDLDGDNEISANDLIEVVRRLTRNGGDEYSSIDKAEAEHVARMTAIKALKIDHFPSPPDCKTLMNGKTRLTFYPWIHRNASKQTQVLDEILFNELASITPDEFLHYSSRLSEFSSTFHFKI